MRFLADENIPAASVGRLQDAGEDVLYVSEACQGVPDRRVLEIARCELEFC